MIKAMVPAMTPVTVLALVLLVKIVRLLGLDMAPDENGPVPELIRRLLLY